MSISKRPIIMTSFIFCASKRSYEGFGVRCIITIRSAVTMMAILTTGAEPLGITALKLAIRTSKKGRNNDAQKALTVPRLLPRMNTWATSGGRSDGWKSLTTFFTSSSQPEAHDLPRHNRSYVNEPTPADVEQVEVASVRALAHRQGPDPFSSRDLHFLTVKDPVATECPEQPSEEKRAQNLTHFCGLEISEVVESGFENKRIVANLVNKLKVVEMYCSANEDVYESLLFGMSLSTELQVAGGILDLAGKESHLDWHQLQVKWNQHNFLPDFRKAVALDMATRMLKAEFKERIDRVNGLKITGNHEEAAEALRGLAEDVLSVERNDIETWKYKYKALKDVLKELLDQGGSQNEEFWTETLSSVLSAALRPEHFRQAVSKALYYQFITNFRSIIEEIERKSMFEPSQVLKVEDRDSEDRISSSTAGSSANSSSDTEDSYVEGQRSSTFTSTRV